MTDAKKQPSDSLSRRDLLKAGAALGATAGVAWSGPAAAQDTVKLGVLHSLTGTIAIAEASIVDAEKMAIDEINASGGVMGRKIVPVIEDGASDWPTFAEKTRKLLQRDKVAAIVGCYTSASRKAVLPVLHQFHGLLYYPTYYEGQELDKSVIYTSQEATQSVIAAIEWMAIQGKTFFLVGSDDIYPRTCNKIAKPTIARMEAVSSAQEMHRSATPSSPRSSTRSSPPSPTGSTRRLSAAATWPSTSSSRPPA